MKKNLIFVVDLENFETDSGVAERATAKREFGGWDAPCCIVLDVVQCAVCVDDELCEKNLTALEQENGNLAQVEVDKVTGLVRNI